MSISINYAIKYELDYSTNYKWLDNNECYNSKTGRIIKQTIVGGSIGYCINGKFKSLKSLRTHLKKPIIKYCPFSGQKM